jgi:hypothetical protein
MYACMRRMYACVCACIHACACVRACMPVCVCVHACLCVYAYVHARMCTCLCVCMCACMYAHAHVCMHHARVRVSVDDGVAFINIFFPFYLSSFKKKERENSVKNRRLGLLAFWSKTLRLSKVKLYRRYVIH